MYEFSRKECMIFNGDNVLIYVTCNQVRIDSKRETTHELRLTHGRYKNTWSSRHSLSEAFQYTYRQTLPFLVEAPYLEII